MRGKQVTVETSLKQQLPLNVLITCATISRQTKRDIYHVLHNMMTNQTSGEEQVDTNDDNSARTIRDQYKHSIRHFVHYFPRSEDEKKTSNTENSRYVD